MEHFNLLEFRQLLMRHKIVLTFEGKMSQGVLRNLVETLKEKLSSYEQEGGSDDSRATGVRKVFAVFIELAQNVQNHSAEKVLIDQRETGVGIIVIREGPNGYTVTSGNLIALADATRLATYCDELNALDADGLKKLYKAQLRAERPEDAKGAGIGLIDVLRRAGNPIDHTLTAIDQQYGFMTLSLLVGKG